MGAGLGYAQFSGERPAGLSLGSSWGPAAVAGIDLGVTQRFFVNLSARWVNVESKVKLNGDRVGDVALDAAAGIELHRLGGHRADHPAADLDDLGLDGA